MGALVHDAGAPLGHTAQQRAPLLPSKLWCTSPVEPTPTVSAPPAGSTAYSWPRPQSGPHLSASSRPVCTQGHGTGVLRPARCRRHAPAPCKRTLRAPGALRSTHLQLLDVRPLLRQLPRREALGISLVIIDARNGDLLPAGGVCKGRGRVTHMPLARPVLPPIAASMASVLPTCVSPRAARSAWPSSAQFPCAGS